MSGTQETIRYSGETDAERQAAFQADAAARAAEGWTVQSQITEWPFGRPGVDLAVTYQRTTVPEPEPPAAGVPQSVPPAFPPPAYQPPAFPPPAYQPPAFPPPGYQPPVAPYGGWVQIPATPSGQPQWGQQPSNAPSRSGLAAFVMTSGDQEPMAARWLRRFSVFATPVLFVIGAGVVGPDGPDGKPTRAQYPGMAMLVLFMVVFLVGLAWYVARWRLLHVALRAIVVAILFMLAALFLLVGVGYAIGSPA